jgi:hypothetical protein
MFYSLRHPLIVWSSYRAIRRFSQNAAPFQPATISPSFPRAKRLEMTWIFDLILQRQKLHGLYCLEKLVGNSFG